MIKFVEGKLSLFVTALKLRAANAGLQMIPSFPS
jgi:hypothetical protein